jgi:regulator of protease activity HflC (stomatin/prohibitin superfamily)
MSLEEIRAKRAELERNITALLLDFTQTTGVSIEDVSIQHYAIETVGQRTKDSIITVKLEL